MIWHDVECGGYRADLALWEELAGRAGDPVLELGAGTGRVALHLARRGHEVTAVEVDGRLGAELERRAGAEALPVSVEVADARELALDRRFALVLAPMQLLQLLGGRAGRRACLGAIVAHLEPGGHAALALVEELPDVVDSALQLPDVREVGGWVYSSLPLGVAREGAVAVVTRLRQVISPAGEMSERHEEVRLELASPEEIERDAAEAGLRGIERRGIPPTDEHVGSTVLLLEAPK